MNLDIFKYFYNIKTNKSWNDFILQYKYTPIYTIELMKVLAEFKNVYSLSQRYESIQVSNITNDSQYYSFGIDVNKKYVIIFDEFNLYIFPQDTVKNKFIYLEETPIKNENTISRLFNTQFNFK